MGLRWSGLVCFNPPLIAAQAADMAFCMITEFEHKTSMMPTHHSPPQYTCQNPSRDASHEHWLRCQMHRIAVSRAAPETRGAALETAIWKPRSQTGWRHCGSTPALRLFAAQASAKPLSWVLGLALRQIRSKIGRKAKANISVRELRARSYSAPRQPASAVSNKK